MVKLRDARYCNVKLLLIFLVVYGHLIEPGIWQSKLLMAQYKWIYLFHMPLFSFLSGLFLNDSKTCGRQCTKMLPLYIVLQALSLWLGNGKVKPLTPYWHLWYLLSCSTWAGLGWLWFRFFRRRGKITVLILSVLVGCLAGLHPDIGREHSLSRTLVFLPYFWASLVWDPRFSWERLRLPSLAALCIVIIVMGVWGDHLPVTFLYQAAPYNKQGNGIALRLLCYLLGVLLCLFSLSWTPMRRFPFTRAGADTMPAYLIHAPIVLYIRKLNMPWPCYPVIALAILYTIYKLLQWHSRLYGIVPTERRGSRCQPSKRLTKNTHSRSIGSCCPWPAVRIWQRSCCRKHSIRHFCTSTNSRDDAVYTLGSARLAKTHGARSADETVDTVTSAGTP